MEISAGLVKDLREKTGAGMMDCKKALTETSGDFEKAVEFLRKKGLSSAAKKAGRTASEGLISSYIHAGGKIGVLVEINCETDFVARNEQFQAFVRDVAMHIAAANPRYVRPDEVPDAVIDKEREIFLAQLKQDPKNVSKPPQVMEKIIAGKARKFLDEVCLVNQAYVKDPGKTIAQLTTEVIAKIGENIVIRRFTRFQLGEGLRSGEAQASA
ncbi:MAG: translation elongation factor Ts [Deltaproteobacteria bacterium]|nr:translation elongation factor Ts [Deltaproteobacteria bacterium]